MAKLPLQKNSFSRALKDMAENVMYNNYKKVGGLSKQESSASMSERGVSIKHKRLKVSGKVFSFAKYLLSMIDRVSLTYLWQSEETLMINSFDHKSFPSMTN